MDGNNGLYKHEQGEEVGDKAESLDFVSSVKFLDSKCCMIWRSLLKILYDIINAPLSLLKILYDIKLEFHGYWNFFNNGSFKFFL
jgi:hypothetical protein